MPVARAHLVDVAVTRWYHRVTRCFRHAFLPGHREFDESSCVRVFTA
jgi:hypothetical protein